jgi:hypothetical protein
MKPLFYLLAALILTLATPPLNAQDRPPRQKTGASEAQQSGQREMLPSGGFSLRVPEGFEVTKNAEKDALSCTRASDRATFEARQVEFDGDLAALAKAANDGMQAELTGYRLLDQKPFALKSGIKGLKLHLEMRPGDETAPLVRQVLYFFDATPGHKGFVTCGALAKQDAKLHPLWDEIVGSVVIAQAKPAAASGDEPPYYGVAVATLDEAVA